MDTIPMRIAMGDRLRVGGRYLPSLYNYGAAKLTEIGNDLYGPGSGVK